MQDLGGALDHPAENVPDALVPETDPESRILEANLRMT